MKSLLKKRLRRFRSQSSVEQPSRDGTERTTTEDPCVLSSQQTREVCAWMFRLAVDAETQRRFAYLIRECISPMIHRLQDWVEYPSGDHCLRGHSEWVYTALVSEDGQLLFTGGVGNSLMQWDLPRLQCRLRWKAHANAVRSLALHWPSLVSGSSDTTLRIWDVSHTPRLLRTLIGHSKDVTSVRFSSDGQTIVSGSHDKSVRVWRVHSGECLTVLLGHSHYVSSVLCCDDGTIISGAWDESVRVWDAQTQQCCRTIDDSLLSLVFSLTVNRSRSRIACICGGSLVWFGWPIQTELRCNPIPTAEFCFSGCFHPSMDPILAVGFNSGRVELLSLKEHGESETVRSLIGHSDIVRDVCFTPDGRRLISVSSDQSVRMWDVSFLFSEKSTDNSADPNESK